MANIAPFTRPLVGQFRITELREDWVAGETDEDLIATLDNAEERCIVRLGADSNVQGWRLKRGEIVAVKGKRRYWADNEFIDLDSLQPLSEDLVDNGAALLPREQCPELARAALDRLVALNDTLEPPPLRDFLTRVLLDPAIGIPFMRARAAPQYHHAYPGGLLVHSTEMLTLAAKLAKRAEPSFPLASGIIQLGYLLHDLGKVDTTCESGFRLLGALVPHADQSLMRIGQHISWLSTKWPEGAAWLSAILSYCAKKPKDRPYNAWMGCQIVVFLDRMSVACEVGAGGVPFRLPDPPDYERPEASNDDC